MGETDAMKEQYILMKASRMPAKEIARTVDAYMGPTCEAAGIEPGKVYSTFEDAARDALALKDFNIVGWRVWCVGESFPAATTERGDMYRQRPVPKISLTQDGETG